MSPAATLDRDVTEATAMAITDIVPEGWVKVRKYDPTLSEFVSAEIEQLRALKLGWDGRHAPVLDERILRAAERVLRTLEPYLTTRPAIVPLVNGSVQIEWHDGPKVLEFEFEGTETIHYLKWNPPTAAEDEDFFATDDVDSARALLTWFRQTD
jgi:hypothetical protein